MCSLQFFHKFKIALNNNVFKEIRFVFTRSGGGGIGRRCSKGTNLNLQVEKNILKNEPLPILFLLHRQSSFNK